MDGYAIIPNNKLVMCRGNFEGSNLKKKTLKVRISSTRMFLHVGGYVSGTRVSCCRVPSRRVRAKDENTSTNGSRRARRTRTETAVAPKRTGRGGALPSSHVSRPHLGRSPRTCAVRVWLGTFVTRTRHTPRAAASC
jgi:hypothetical protein